MFRLWIERVYDHQSSFWIKLIELVVSLCKREGSWNGIGRAFRGQFSWFVNLNLFVVEGAAVWDVKHLRLAVLELIYDIMQLLSGLRKCKKHFYSDQTAVFPPKRKQHRLDFFRIHVNLMRNQFSEEPLTWIVVNFISSWFVSRWNIKIYDSWKLTRGGLRTKVTEFHG